MRILVIFCLVTTIPLMVGATCPAGFTATPDVVLVNPSDPCPNGFTIATGVSHTHFIPILGDSSKGNWTVGGSFNCPTGPANTTLTRVCRRN